MKRGTIAFFLKALSRELTMIEKNIIHFNHE